VLLQIDRCMHDSPKVARADASISKNVTKLVLVSAVIAVVVGCYWVFVYQPTQEDSDFVEVRFNGRVVDAQSAAFVPGAVVTVSLANGTSVEAVTGTSGEFAINLGKQKKGTTGKIHVQAEKFGILMKNVSIDSPRSYQELRVQALKYEHHHS
jgi:hypothetical protein